MTNDFGMRLKRYIMAMRQRFRKLIYWSRFALAVCLVTTHVAVALSQDAAPGDDVIAEYDMRDYGEFWSLPLTFRGTTYRLFVDTGSGQFFFDESLRPLFGEPVWRRKIETSTSDVELPIFVVREAQVGAVRMRRPCTAACIDLSGLKACAGADVAGVLGCAFLRSYIVQFDFEKAHLCFLRSIPERAGYKVPFDGDDMRPHCHCSLDGRDEESYLLDTGSVAMFSVTLRKQLFDDLADEARASDNLVVVPRLSVIGTETTGEFVGGDHTEPCGVLRRFALGRFGFEKVRARRGRSSSIGLRFMSRFVVTIDFPDRAVYFKPIQGSGRDDFDAGVVIGRDGKRTFVRGIVPTSRAAGTALSAGDDIVRINSEDTAATNIFALRRTLGRKAPDTTLTIKRTDGTEMDVRIPADPPARP